MKFLFQWICSSAQMTLHFNFNSPSIGCMKSSWYTIIRFLYCIWYTVENMFFKNFGLCHHFLPQCLIPTLLPHLPQVMKDIIHLKPKRKSRFHFQAKELLLTDMLLLRQLWPCKLNIQLMLLISLIMLHMFMTLHYMENKQLFSI